MQYRFMSRSFIGINFNFTNTGNWETTGKHLVITQSLAHYITKTLHLEWLIKSENCAKGEPERSKKFSSGLQVNGVSTLLYMALIIRYEIRPGNQIKLFYCQGMISHFILSILPDLELSQVDCKYYVEWKSEFHI